MTILTVSDIHGRNVWKEINTDTHDQIVFLGDYTDSYVFDDETIYNNLLDIIQLKRSYPDKIVLLIGNHDAQYMHFPYYRCSGFRPLAQPMLSEVFEEYEGLFQIAYQQGSYLFTHAGITNQWLAHLLEKTENNSLSITPDYDLAELLNDVHQRSMAYRNLLFEVGPRRGGNDPFGGPIWADRQETKVDYLSGFHQVVGHTPINEFTTFGDTVSSITYTDVLQTKSAFYEIIIPD
ncbi:MULTISPECIES: metallophosphoesterase [unclassified Spirosoma]|uniref:metallophosphoesterase n=1 Tax=unclassified Spirosoma TaxID=2621999 RepID=UPI000969B65C|nr:MULTISPECIES: metallophosphoesterase [unclassified Spirosoma]MBN8826211.1 metallophosphoesterase [Spirosoma sp.]OJW76894.1 MAG: metallophosphoesterase [Spirosoma sp. 48-14]